MTIQELVDKIKDISLNKVEGIKSFYIGNTWDMSNTKQDIYPCVWFEMPILTEYSVANKLTKQFTFSIDVLNLPLLDDTTDEINQISHMEELADEILYWLAKENNTCDNKVFYSLVDKPNGLTVKSINADIACGIRLDIKVNSARKCLTSCPK